MAVLGKCRRIECAFEFDDGEHMDDAIAKLRAHFRMEHPTKSFYEQSYKEYVEMYNCTLDEAVENYLGKDWRNTRESRQIINACNQLCTYATDYPPALIGEIRALAAQHGRDIPDPYAPGGANAAVLAGLAGIVPAYNPPIIFDDDEGPEEPF